MSIYRKVVWYVKGKKEYTKAGYALASKSFNAADLEVDCTERCYMITGANSGIGKVAAREIAKKGGTIHLVCRSRERGEEAVEEIKSVTGNQNVHLHLLDLSQPRKVMSFAREFVASGGPLHVLVNNAGCMVNQREEQDDGLEKNFATNTLGTHILTVELAPLLAQQSDARVITVSSGGMLTQKLDLSDLQFAKMKPFEGTMAYAMNKRQQVIMTHEYAKIYPTIQFSSMHPGWADTPAVATSMPEFYAQFKDQLRSPEEGTDTIVWLAISPAARKEKSGDFFQDRKVVPEHLPLAWSDSSAADKAKLMTALTDIAKRFS